MGELWLVDVRWTLKFIGMKLCKVCKLINEVHIFHMCEYNTSVHKCARSVVPFEFTKPLRVYNFLTYTHEV